MQFSIKRLLLGTTLIGLGLGMYVTLVRFCIAVEPGKPMASSWVLGAVWLGSGAMIGAWASMPFKHPILGAIGGLFVYGLLFALLMILLAASSTNTQ
jgi:hypothetical protein